MQPVIKNSQVNRINVIRPDAPNLAGYGDYHVGVRTLTLIDENRVDVLNTQQGQPNTLYDRSLTVEVWYPAALGREESPGGEYRTITRNPEISTTLFGQGVRDAAPNLTIGRCPLVVISHGYPGNRFLMSHLGENLASKGFVAVSIDHRDSTYDDQQAVSSTLYNRSLDQRAVIQRIDELSEDESSVLYGLVDASNTGVVGYSMGGFGLINNLGGGFSDVALSSPMAPPNELLAEHAARNPLYAEHLDPRIKAGFAIAPWGMESGVWLAEDLAGITTPTFYVAGDNDTISGYERGVRAIYDNAVNSDRYLLTYQNAGHNAGAPYPVPWEILDSPTGEGADHYMDPVWDNVRMNNVLNHFATAFFRLYLNADSSMSKYLDLSQEGVNATNAPPGDWSGFPQGSTVGLTLEKLLRGSA
jgi:predicted dienelactone hydrolase